jgi:hypothetical protein
MGFLKSVFGNFSKDQQKLEKDVEHLHAPIASLFFGFQGGEIKGVVDLKK